MALKDNVIVDFDAALQNGFSANSVINSYQLKKFCEKCKDDME